VYLNELDKLVYYCHRKLMRMMSKSMATS